MNSTTWMSRYLAGEHEAVWTELRQCPEETPEATAVLTETLARGRRNVEVLVSRWKARGYVFEEMPWTEPSSQVDSLLTEVERLCGPVPLALRLFWRQVGEPFVLPLAPETLHKANVSGGMPHVIRLPASPWEGLFVGEDSRGVPFIDYLRTCFRWDGVPGFARVEERPSATRPRGWCRSEIVGKRRESNP